MKCDLHTTTEEPVTDEPTTEAPVTTNEPQTQVWFNFKDFSVDLASEHSGSNTFKYHLITMQKIQQQTSRSLKRVFVMIRPMESTLILSVTNIFNVSMLAQDKPS